MSKAYSKQQLRTLLHSAQVHLASHLVLVLVLGLLCPVFCVSVFCVLCSVFCVLCSVFCILCSVFCSDPIGKSRSSTCEIGVRHALRKLLAEGRGDHGTGAGTGVETSGAGLAHRMLLRGEGQGGKDSTLVRHEACSMALPAPRPLRARASSVASTTRISRRSSVPRSWTTWRLSR